MGVTTIVIGNCGDSELDVGALFKRLETRSRPAVNVATLIGHNVVRAKAMGGNVDRVPTDKEMSAMKAMVAKAMDDGALGLSTGLIYMPGTFSKTPELVELAKVVKPYGGMYVSHMRSESSKIYEALDEVFAVAREAGVPAHVSHIKLGGNAMWGQAAKVVQALDQARKQGLAISADQYAYAASSTTMSVLLPDFAFDGGRAKLLARLADPPTRARISDEMKAMLQRSGREDYSYAVITGYAKDRRLNGLRVPAAAKLKYGDDSLDRQIELVMEIVRNGSASAVFHGMSEDDVRYFMAQPGTMFGSDSEVRRFKEGMPHPRGYGNAARVLARYVREQGVLTLADAIRKMTSLPSAYFGLGDRGILKVGFPADAVVFDPAKAQDLATYEKPHQYATGFTSVIVNGREVLRDGKPTRERPGVPLRGATRPVSPSS